MPITSSQIPGSRRLAPWSGVLRLGVALALLALTLGTLRAQENMARYYINSPQPNQNSLGELAAFITELTRPGPAGTGLVTIVFYPQFGVSAVVAILTPTQRDVTARRGYDLHLDFLVRPNDTETWPLNHWTPLPPAATAPAPIGLPVVYVVDSGINDKHTEFQYIGRNEYLTFLPGTSFGINHNANPPELLSPYVDPSDHGTRVTGCLGGRTTGLLGALGGRAQVKSINIYDSPPQAGTFASQAIQGILQAVTDHQTRKAQPYLRNHASVLVFAHSTEAAAGRMAALDNAVLTAWREGLHVILSAGNQNALAAQVSPAGAAWGHVPIRSTPVRFWDGLPPAGATYYRAEDALLVVGAAQSNGKSVIRWPQSNINTATVDAIDLFAPGAAISCPSGLSNLIYVNASGTSMAAGFTAALTTWAVARCPWARPAQIRKVIRDATVGVGDIMVAPTTGLPTTLDYAAWIEHYFPAAFHTPAERHPEGDPDGDGVANFVEYRCGQDPRFRDAHLAPTLTVTPGAPASQITVRMPVASYLGPSPQVSWELQLSDSLSGWVALPVSTANENGLVLKEGDARVVEYTANGPPVPGRAYFRLRFSAAIPPP